MVAIHFQDPIYQQESNIRIVSKTVYFKNQNTAFNYNNKKMTLKKKKENTIPQTSGNPHVGILHEIWR